MQCSGLLAQCWIINETKTKSDCKIYMELLLKDLDFFYINLDHDLEKSKALEIKLDLMDIPSSKIHRVKAHLNSTPYIGILESQIDAIEAGLQIGTPFVVLEDDAQINNFYETIKIGPLSNCTYLGLSSWELNLGLPNLAKLGKVQYEQLEDSEICRIKNMLSSHAILHHDQEYSSELLMNLKRIKNGNSILIKGNEFFPKYYEKSVIPCDIVMAMMQSNYFVTALKIPFFYQNGQHEYCTRFSLV